MSCKELGQSTNSISRKLQVKDNLTSAWKANDVFIKYIASKGIPAWTEIKLKKPFYDCWDAEGTINTTNTDTFDITSTLPASPVLPTLTGGLAIFYDKTELTAKVSAGEIVDIADVDFAVLNIVSGTSSEITVESEIPAGYTDVFILEEAYHDLPLLTDFSFDPASALIDVTNQNSGGYTENIEGVANADITGIVGKYSTDYPITLMLRYYNIKKGCPVYVRHYASLNLHEPVYYQTVLANQLSVVGATDSSSALDYNGTLINNGGAPIVKSVITEGVVPSL